MNSANADIITSDQLKALVSWKGVSDVGCLNIYSRPIRIRFDMVNASLYSFGCYEYHGTKDKPILRVKDTTVQEEGSRLVATRRTVPLPSTLPRWIPASSARPRVF